MKRLFKGEAYRPYRLRYYHLIKMNFNKFVCGLFNKTLAFLTSFSLVFQAPLLTYLYAQSPAIVPDGRTQTSVISNPTGTVTDIRTNSIRGINAYNSFEKFNVPNGNTTNLHVPNSARNLVNLVHNERSQIDGILNSYKNGQIGGNVFFLNPHGIVVGAGGVVNVGSLNLQTPTSQYLKDLISTNGEISAIHEQQLFEGKVPLSPSGVISVKGKINAVEEIQLKAGNVNISENAQVRAGRQVQVEFGDLVNVQGVNWGNDIIVTPEGKIKIVAVNDVNIAGKVKADAVAGNDAGKIEIESGNDINVQKGANISAKAETQNSNGGEIIIYADNNSTLEKDALIDVSATQNAKGGFLEFSATKNVNITGNGLKSSTGGKILIDPDDINWTGSGKDQFTSNGANYELLADKSIKLTDVYISTRQVSGSDRNAHLNGDSTGNSGNITLKAEDITLTNSYLLTHATGNYNAGNIIIEAMPHVENGNVTLATNVDVKLVNSFLYANASGTGTAGDVKISLTDNSWNTKYDYGGDSNLSFTMDKDSVIKGKNVDVKVVSVSGTKIELNKDAESDSDGVLDGVGEKVADTAETVLDLVVGIAGSLLITGRNNQTHAKINIEGTIEATGDIKIDSLAESHAEFMNIGVIVTLAGVYIEANSEVTIGGNAVIKTLGSGSVNITSKAVTVADITTMELGLVNKVPADVAIAVVVAYSDNKLTVNSGAEITSAKDIAIEALTERTQAVSVSSGSGDSTFGLTLGMIYGDSNVDAKIDGNLSAVENIMLSAKTDTKKNQIVTATTLADGLYTNITKALNQTTGLIDGVKGGIFGGIKKITKGKVDLTTPSADKPFDSLGIAGAIALLLDNVTTNLTVGANAQAALTAGDDISIDAQTINKVAVVANSTIGEYTVNQQETKKDRGIAASIPIVVMNNSTKAVVNSATLKADKNISINAETKIPYNMEHPLYNLFADGKEFEMSSLTSLLSSNLGIDKGMFNTWAQSTASTDEWGMGGMVSLQFIENETVAKIVNASVSGKTNFSKPALTVTANTVTEMGNMTGSIRSFFSRFPNFADEKSQWTDQTFQTMWGQEGEGGAIGAAFLGSFIDNTTIARIDGGTIDAGDVKVKANTSSLDIGISIGGGKAGGLGIEGMFGMTFYDSYTLAKIDDAVKVTAKSVDIFADDTAYRIGIAGGVVEGTTGIGISAIVSNLDRQAHAVWGNLLNENGKLVTIKGDSIAETLVDNPVVSVVNGDTNIKSTLSGLNVVAAVAGTKTDQTHQEEDDEAANDFSVYMQDLFDEDNPFKMDGATRKKYTKESEAESGFGVSGAVAVNVMTEKVSSGISGNVKIITNDLVVKALNSIIDISVAGGVVIQTGSEKGNTGIAGGFGINYLSGDTLAYIEPKTNTETNSIIFDSLKVDASRGGLIVSVSAGASGSSANEGTQVAGSVSYAGIFDDTLVQIKNAYLTEKSVGNVSANATNDAQIIAVGGGLAIGGKTAVGASIAVNQLSLNTHANIYNSIIDVNNLSLISGNESSIVTIALAGAVGNENAGAGTVAVVLSNGTTQTAIDSSTLTLTGNLVAGAVSKAGLGSGSYYGDLVDELQSSEGSDTSYLSNNGTTLNTKEEDNTGSDTNLALGLGNASPKIVTAALAFAVSNSAVGANIGLNILTDTTNVSISGSTISSNNVTFEAGTEGGIIAVGVGIAGGASKFGVAGNVAVNLVGGSTTVDLTNNANISATNNLTAQALNTAGITNVAVNVAGSSGTGVAASLAYNQLAHKTQVYANNTILSGGSVDIDALNSASIISVLLSVGGGGSNGVGVSLAINTIGKLSGREVENNEGGDSTNDEMEARKNLADSFGNAGIIDTIANSTNETGINLINSSITATNGNIDLDAAISGRMISIAVGAGFGGSVGAGAAGAYNNIGGASRIVTNNTAFTQNGEGKITADSVSDNDIIAVSIGGGGGGSVGVGVGAAVNNLTGVNEIKFENDTKTITANGDISLNAENSGEIISVAGGVAGGGSVGVGAAVTVNLLKGNTVAQIIGGTTISTTGNVSIKSSNDSDILSVAAAGAGGGAVGVTGSVAVNLIKGTTESRIGNSTTKTTVNGKTGVALDAKSTGKILSIGGGIAGGGAVGVAGSVAYNEISSIVRAIVEGQSSNQTSILSQNGIFAVRALNDNEIKNIIVNAAGAGTVSVAALSGTNKIAGTTEAVVKNVTATTLNAVDINATNSSDTFGVNVFAAVSGLVSVGVALDIELLEQTVKVVLENAALTASTTIDIGATNDVTIKPNVVGIAGSGVASVGGAISVVKTNSVTGVTLTNADLTATNGLSIDAASKVTLQQIIGSAAVAGVAGVAVTAGANVFNQKTNINIDQASSLISTNNNISVYGKTET
ncbi:MAG: leukotoxin LktA family filamentous adhesin, partial [Planctomycetaceae bacterium]|nr:leukotoxin LktA family filamentous adhesin [Planctomycetaceae bacterium]